ncbi:hypothetical protein PC110_g9272 [Phytophthora cactorum]|uniref:Uncharacterized protein n=1 Tax=Phytophthora cactorum TaxID=29920 RepID=A0A329SCA4_9STRA|nr:hypothetical protein PC110_g9272 [Phytophthora cactorum]
MASVAPTLGPVSDLAINTALQRAKERRWKSLITKLLRVWQHMQLSYYGGKYSIHRVLALDEYCRNTSLSRVLLVCLATPLPMVALIFGQELIPLQELSEGWSASYGMWIRVAVLVGIVTHALLIQATYLIDDFRITMSQRLQLYAIMSAIVVALAMVVASNFVFPIPFFILFVTPPFYLLLIVMLRVVIGSNDYRQMLKNRVQVVRCVRFVCAQTSTVFIFPVYEMLFNAAEGTEYQLPVILLLPVIKVALKNLVLYFAKALDDMAPVEVIFTADFFNAIYVATSIKSSTSIAAISAITITDLSQTFIMLYGLQRRTATILSRLGQASDNPTSTDTVLSIMSGFCRNPEVLQKEAHTGIRRRSCLPHQISAIDKSLLDSLDQTLGVESLTKSPVIQPDPNNSSSPFRENNSSMNCLRRICVRSHVNGIYPIVHNSEMESYTRTTSKDSNILLESLQILFTTECLVTTAYLEAFMPLFYSSYMVLMVHLPNVRYHLEMAKVTRENIVSTVLPLVVFGLLQIVSFALLVVVIKRNCRMKPLYQLAFVLETQWSLVQCKMMLWMVITLCFRVTHFGVDFKFEFIRLGLPRFWVPQG